MKSEDDGCVDELLDELLDHVFRAGLSLASAHATSAADSAANARIDEARAQLDLLAARIRRAAFSRTAQPPGDGGPYIPHHARLLRRVEAAFAYARDGSDWVRVVDGVLWAHERDDVLYSSNGGRPIARRHGGVLYDIESRLPLYCEESASGI